jgi:D-arabinose 1-dehydrogenase-like Zn-dependent alcohol dehydrogenase
MAETARMAVFHGAGKPFEIREYPVPDPEPGAILVKVAMANVCGSDLHYWRGELDYVKMGRPLPLNTGHEHVGRVAKLGPRRHHRLGGPAAAVGDRASTSLPCGAAAMCLRQD